MYGVIDDYTLLKLRFMRKCFLFLCCFFALSVLCDAQILSVIKLSKEIIERHDIRTQNVVGHSDIAPDRKEDPGEHFPWAGLAAAGIGFWPSVLPEDDRVVFAAGDRDRGISIIQRGLADIGYGASVTGCLDESTQAIIRAIQRRYRPDRIDGVIDIPVMEILKQLSEMIRVSESNASTM